MCSTDVSSKKLACEYSIMYYFFWARPPYRVRSRQATLVLLLALLHWPKQHFFHLPKEAADNNDMRQKQQQWNMNFLYGTVYIFKRSVYLTVHLPIGTMLVVAQKILASAHKKNNGNKLWREWSGCCWMCSESGVYQLPAEERASMSCEARMIYYNTLNRWAHNKL